MLALYYFLLYIHLYYILVKFQHSNSIICIIIDDFVFLPPFSFILTLFGLYDALELRNYFRSACFILFLLPIHLYYILVKLQHFNNIICTIIGDFLFLPSLKLHFVPFSDLCEALELRNYFRNACFALCLLPIHLYYILVKLQHFNSIIYIIIDDFVIFTPTPFLAPFWHLWGPRIGEVFQKCMFWIISVAYPFILHIGEVPEVQYHYLHHYWCFLPSFSLIFGLFWLLWCPSTEELLHKCMFVLFLLPIHLYFILVKSQHFNSIIYIIIDDFVIFTPFSIIFGPFLTFWGPTTEELLQKCMFCIISVAYPLLYILVKFQKVNSIICIIIDDFVLFTPIQLHFWPCLTFVMP